MRFSYFIIIDTNFLTVCTLTVRLYKSISTKLSYQVVACFSFVFFGSLLLLLFCYTHPHTYYYYYFLSNLYLIFIQ